MKILYKFRATIKNIHRILEFKQEPFSKPNIKRNTDLQREADKEGSKIKKQNAKLRSNAIFGKSIEPTMNKRAYNFCMKIVTTRKQFKVII